MDVFAVQQLVVTSWFAPTCTSWFLRCYKTSPVLHLGERVYVCEHGLFTEWELWTFPATTRSPSLTIAVACHQFCVFRRKADAKKIKLLGALLFLAEIKDTVALDEVFDKDLDGGEWGFHDVESALESDFVVCAGNGIDF